MKDEVLFSAFLTDVLVSGMLRRRFAKDGGNPHLGVGPENCHIYRARAGLLDVDYIGHMNNSSYLSHAEYARWEMAAETGMLQTMMSKDIHFILSGNFIRYRREVRPLFRSFQVESYISAIDDRSLWFTHNLRYSDNDRLRAQILAQAVIVQNRKVLLPRDFLRDVCGHEEDLIDRVTWPDGQDVSHADLLNAYRDLDNNMRSLAAKDDEKHKQTSWAPFGIRFLWCGRCLCY